LPESLDSPALANVSLSLGAQTTDAYVVHKNEELWINKIQFRNSQDLMQMKNCLYFVYALGGNTCITILRNNNNNNNSTTSSIRTLHLMPPLVTDYVESNARMTVVNWKE
jgi:hypothetical protein